MAGTLATFCPKRSAATLRPDGEDLAGEEKLTKKSSGFQIHLQALRELYSETYEAGAENLGARPADLADVLAELACGRRSDGAHWRDLLNYCVQGNLQAVLDEYAHLLAGGLDGGGPRLPALHEQLLEGLALRTTPYDADTFEVFKRRAKGEDRTGKNKTKLRSHFTAAFTKGDSQEKDANRKRKVRSAFNAPFRPFVLATTSIGQEGLDFHNYCRRIVHWNLPAKPHQPGTAGGPYQPL